MAGNGPPPSENRHRRNADTFEDQAVTVSADAAAEAPELPHGPMYGPQTRAWYETWTRAPQAAAFTVTDWQRLHMLAPIVEQYFLAPSTKLLSEIRLNESLLGATHVDRLRGRIKIEQPAAPSSRPPADVPDLTERRKRLMTDAS